MTTKHKGNLMAQLTDLLLIIDKSDLKPEDPKMLDLTVEQATNILFNIIPNSLEAMFERIIKDRNVIENLYWATFPSRAFDELNLTIDFPYVELHKNNIQITWHYMTDSREKDMDTWTLNSENVLNNLG